MLCDNKRNLYYNEIKLQVELGVLESDEWYNANIGGIKFFRPVKSYLSQELREKLSGVNGSSYRGPFLVSYYGGLQEWVSDITLRDWCREHGYAHQRIYELRNGKREMYKNIVALEYQDENN